MTTARAELTTNSPMYARFTASATARTRIAFSRGMRKLHACVLVVDDNEINRMVTSEQLLELGYQVQVATNGREAVDFVQQYECAAVLMDCEMPVMDGYAATREIRRREGHQHIPIIAVSAHDDAESRARMLEAGMDGHMGRPLTNDQLAATLARFVRVSITSEQRSLHKPISIDSTDVELDAGIPRCTEVLQLTLELVPAQIDAIGDALTRGDGEAARARTHKLKGSALSIGARRMAHVARGLERDLRDGAQVDVQSAIDSLRERFEQLLPLLHEEMRSRASGRPASISVRAQPRVVVVDGPAGPGPAPAVRSSATTALRP